MAERNTREVFSKNFRKALNEYNNGKGLSQNDFIELVNQRYFPGKAKIKKSSVSNWYQGNSFPRADLIPYIADFFDVPVSYFFIDPEKSDQALPPISVLGIPGNTDDSVRSGLLKRVAELPEDKLDALTAFLDVLERT